jgi:hypothetical protein
MIYGGFAIELANDVPFDDIALLENQLYGLLKLDKPPNYVVWKGGVPVNLFAVHSQSREQNKD